MNSTLPRRTYLYFTAQSINLTTAVMSVTMAAIVGAALAPDAAWSTVPYGFQFLCLMLATYPVSRLMGRIGRKKAFMLGAIPLALSGVSGFLAVEHQHFPTQMKRTVPMGSSMVPMSASWPPPSG